MLNKEPVCDKKAISRLCELLQLKADNEFVVIRKIKTWVNML